MTAEPEVTVTETEAPPPLPEVRQCQNAESFQYGAVAVDAGDGRWGVMNATNGGHWATDADVADWVVLS